MPHLRNIFILLTILLLSSCHNPSRIEGIFDLVENESDSALQVLSSIDRNGLNDDELAEWGLAYCWALDRSGVDVGSDSVLRIAYDHYSRRPDAPYYARCMYYMGKYYVLADSAECARVCLASAIASARARRDTLTDCLASDCFASTLINIAPDSAETYAHHAAALYCQLPNADTANIVQYKLREAICATYNNHSREAVSIYHDALALARCRRDSLLQSMCCQGIAFVYSVIDEKDSALHYAKAAFDLRPNNQDNSLTLSLASAYLAKDSTRQARGLLQDMNAKTLAESYDKNYYLLTSYIQEGNTDGAGKSMPRAFDELETWCRKEMKAKDEYYNEALQAEREKSEIESRAAKRTHILVLILILAAAALAFGIYYWRNDREKAVEERKAVEIQHQKDLYQQKLAFESALHREELSHKETQLATMRQFLMRKIEIIDRLCTLDADQKSRVAMTDDDWHEIAVFLDGMDNLFVSRLRAAFPSLREKDYRFFMLLRLKLSTKSLATLYGISEKSVRQNLFLYKDKVGLAGKDTSLRTFIEAF